VAVFIVGALLLTDRDKVPARQDDNGGIVGEVSIAAPKETDKKLSVDYAADFYIKRGDRVDTLSGLKGKKIFINFWNTWCPPCREEMPDLNQLYIANKDKVEFIFINIAPQEKSVDEIEYFLKNNKLQIPVYLDKDASVTQAYGIRSIPATVVIGTGGEVEYARSGGLTYEQAANLIL
jgi:thiol-disulfide isomerase/thioredoxin